MNEFIIATLVMCLVGLFAYVKNQFAILKAKNESFYYRNKDLESKLMKAEYESDIQDKKELKLLQEYQRKINDLELQIEDYKIIRQHQNKVDNLKGSRESLEIDINVIPQPYDYRNGVN